MSRVGCCFNYGLCFLQLSQLDEQGWLLFQLSQLDKQGWLLFQLSQLDEQGWLLFQLWPLLPPTLTVNRHDAKVFIHFDGYYYTWDKTKLKPCRMSGARSPNNYIFDADKPLERHDDCIRGADDEDAMDIEH
jgi:hypothetical protein